MMLSHPYSKYSARRTVFRGQSYDSVREARHAGLLRQLKRAIDPAKRVTKVERQVKFILQPAPNKITYVCDFKVTFADGHVEYHEVKGYETPVFKLKMKLMNDRHPDITITMIR